MPEVEKRATNNKFAGRILFLTEDTLAYPPATRGRRR